MIRIIFTLFFYAALYLPVAADEDFSNVRDPFAEPPAIQIIETSVEQKPPRVDNGFQAQMAPVVAVTGPAAVMQPIQPVKPPVISLPALNVEGVIWGGRPMVIINGTVLSLDSTFNGVKIKSIQRNGIDVVYKGKKFHIAADL